MSTENLSSPRFHPVLDTFHPLLDETTANNFVGNWREAVSEIKGRSPAMERVLSTVTKVARSDCPVLIHGESGTGKELIARALHRLSPRANRRFVAINCGAIPESLMESELFGYVKGAFTGADQKRKGYFEEAAGGTIFLDEIGDMPLRLQAKLLRVIQEKQFSPIGSNEVKRADVRVIAATNVNLEEAVRQQSFRLDLFYRLNVLPIHLPSLRERRADIRLLLEHFLQVANQQHGLIQPCFLSAEVYHVLEAYNWPGNVRELQNLVERLVVMTGGGAIQLSELPAEYRGVQTDRSAQHLTVNEVSNSAKHHAVNTSIGSMPEEPLMSKAAVQQLSQGLLPEEGMDLTSYIEELENTLILQALERTGHNKNQAAKLLGLNRTTLVERIKKRGLAPLNSPSKEL
ncbi:MAG: sigma-54 interaction domain-containing protein [Oligoflexus sp.]